MKKHDTPTEEEKINLKDEKEGGGTTAETTERHVNGIEKDIGKSENFESETRDANQPDGTAAEKTECTKNKSGAAQQTPSENEGQECAAGENGGNTENLVPEDKSTSEETESRDNAEEKKPAEKEKVTPRDDSPGVPEEGTHHGETDAEQKEDEMHEGVCEPAPEREQLGKEQATNVPENKESSPTVNAHQVENGDKVKVCEKTEERKGGQKDASSVQTGTDEKQSYINEVKLPEIQVPDRKLDGKLTVTSEIQQKLEEELKTAEKTNKELQQNIEKATQNKHLLMQTLEETDTSKEKDEAELQQLKESKKKLEDEIHKEHREIEEIGKNLEELREEKMLTEAELMATRDSIKKTEMEKETMSKIVCANKETLDEMAKELKCLQECRDDSGKKMKETEDEKVATEQKLDELERKKAELIEKLEKAKESNEKLERELEEETRVHNELSEDLKTVQKLKVEMEEAINECNREVEEKNKELDGMKRKREELSKELQKANHNLTESAETPGCESNQKELKEITVPKTGSCRKVREVEDTVVMEIKDDVIQENAPANEKHSTAAVKTEENEDTEKANVDKGKDSKSHQPQVQDVNTEEGQKVGPATTPQTLTTKGSVSRRTENGKGQHVEPEPGKELVGNIGTKNNLLPKIPEKKSTAKVAPAMQSGGVSPSGGQGRRRNALSKVDPAPLDSADEKKAVGGDRALGSPEEGVLLQIPERWRALWRRNRTGPGARDAASPDSAETRHESRFCVLM